VEQDELIEDLDVIVEHVPTWRDRWLLPALGAIAITAVLATTFGRLAPARSSVFGGPISRPSFVQGAPPAAGIRTLELPRTVAALQARAQISGVTGLTSMDMSEGFRDVYRLGDGRLLIVVEYPDRGATTVASPANALYPIHRVVVRGASGIGYATASTSLAVAIAWSADSMQYVVGGAAFSEEELVGLATQLR
jgi:hypothetical protein